MDVLFKSSALVPPVPKVGDVLHGNVINKEGNMLFVDLGPSKTGIVFGHEYSLAQEYIKSLKAGDSVSVRILEIDGYKGYIELSIHDTMQESLWDSLEERRMNGTVVKVKIQKANHGGLLTVIDRIPAFLPVSQLKNSHYPRVEGGDKQKILAELNKFVGQDLDVKIITVDRKEKHLIISEKGIEDEQFNNLVSLCHVGDIIDGVVSSVVDFGIFIMFTPAGAPPETSKLEGLAHISALDWQLVENPNDLFRVGDSVKAKIIDINNGKISLSVKALKDNPWLKAENTLARGAKISGVVKKFNKFGALIQTEQNIQGLLPARELNAPENTEAKELSVGKTYTFYVIVFSAADHKLILSLKKPSDNPEEVSAEEKSGESPAA